MAQPIRTRRSEIELAVDRGSIMSGRRSRPISEFELELKAGSPVSFRVARRFERKTGAELDLRSKAEKAISLPETAAKAPDMPTQSTSI